MDHLESERESGQYTADCYRNYLFHKFQAFSILLKATHFLCAFFSGEFHGPIRKEKPLWVTNMAWLFPKLVVFFSISALHGPTLIEPIRESIKELCSSCLPFLCLLAVQVGIYSVVQILGGLLAALSAVTIFGKSANLAVTPGYGALVTKTPGSVVGNMLWIMWMPSGCCTYCTCACDISVGFCLFSV